MLSALAPIATDARTSLIGSFVPSTADIRAVMRSHRPATQELSLLDWNNEWLPLLCNQEIDGLGSPRRAGVSDNVHALVGVGPEVTRLHRVRCITFRFMSQCAFEHIKELRPWVVML